jgi:copper transport protein
MNTRTAYHWAIAATLSLLLGVGVALAHPKILSIEPAPDARLEEPPAQLRITFNEALEAISVLALRDSRGREVASGGAPLPDDPATLGLALPPIGPGVYTMVWTVVGSDGHIVKGNAAFTVLGGAAATSPVASPQPTAELPPAQVTSAPAQEAAPDSPPLTAILLRGLMLLGAAVGTGGLALLALLLGPALANSGGDPAGLRRARAWLALPLLICAAAAPLMLAEQTLAAFGTLDLTGLMRVASTRYGALLLARAGLALALAIAAVGGIDNRSAHIGQAALGAGLLLSFSLSGHAAAASAPLLPILADALHLGATALWAGGLVALASVLPVTLRSVPEARRPDLLGPLFAQFSNLALASVALLTATGTYAALRSLGALSDLWTTGYGLALLTKLAAFGAMLLFGAYHLLIVRQARPLIGLTGRTLRLEAALGLIAIIAAGALTSLAPPIDSIAVAVSPSATPTPTAMRVPTVTPGPTRTPVPSQPFDQTQAAGDLRVRLEVSPARIGDDHFRVTVTDQGGAPVETQLVRLGFAMLEMDMGTNQLVATPEGQASYTVSGAPLSMVGAWQVTVTVRRAGVRDVEAIFMVPVGE